MKYEKLDDQSADAQNALKFLPKSMLDSITKSDDPALGRKKIAPEPKKDRIIRLKGGKDYTDDSILPRDINYGQLGVQVAPTLTREEEEKKNIMIASGIGTLSIVILLYVLFLH